MGDEGADTDLIFQFCLPIHPVLSADEYLSVDLVCCYIFAA